MENTRENDKAWIITLSERIKQLEEELANAYYELKNK